MKALATYVDSLIERREAVVSESEAAAVSFHGLAEENASHLLQLLKDAGFSPRVVDSAEQQIDSLDRGVAPFTIGITKEVAGVGFIATGAFRNWMQRAEAIGFVCVASCVQDFRTEGFVVSPWGAEAQPSVADPRPDPAKEVG